MANPHDSAYIGTAQEPDIAVYDDNGEKVPTPVIDPEFQALIPPLTEDERKQLEDNVMSEGCRDAIVVWRSQNTIVDGHNRHAICTRHRIPHKVKYVEFEDRNRAVAWICRNQLGRRNLAQVARDELALRLKDALEREARKNQGIRTDLLSESDNKLEARRTQKEIAAIAGTSTGGIAQTEVILRDAPKPILTAARAGDISRDRAYNLTKALRNLPENARERAAELCGDDITKAETLARLYQSSLNERSTNTYAEILATGGFVYDELDSRCDFATSAAKEIDRRLDLKATWRKRLEMEARIGERIQAAALQPAPMDEIQFVQGDCLVVTAQAPDNIKLVLTDPPYGMEWRSNRRTVMAQQSMIASDDDSAFDLFDKWLALVLPKLAQDAHMLVFAHWRTEHVFRELLSRAGLSIKGSLVWVKNNHTSGDLYGSFAPRHERIIHAVKGRPNVSPRCDDVLMLDAPPISDHPTEKPLPLLRKLIEVTTVPGEWIVDPFAGSASTLVAARELKRRAWGCELESTYHDVGMTRLGVTR